MHYMITCLLMLGTQNLKLRKLFIFFNKPIFAKYVSLLQKNSVQQIQLEPVYPVYPLYDPLGQTWDIWHVRRC